MMRVTPTKKKFGKYMPGDEFDLPDKAAKVFVKIGKLKRVKNPGYLTRMMTAEPVVANEVADVADNAVVDDPVTETDDETTEEAPYGYKADGTPRKRPGRPAQ
jgi:hypothetical protein